MGRSRSCQEPPGRHPERVSIANESKDLGQLRDSEAGTDSANAKRSLKANRCAAISSISARRLASLRMTEERQPLPNPRIAHPPFPSPCSRRGEGRGAQFTLTSPAASRCSRRPLLGQGEAMSRQGEGGTAGRGPYACSMSDGGGGGWRNWLLSLPSAIQASTSRRSRSRKRPIALRSPLCAM